MNKNRRTPQRRLESGQAIVLMALMMVGLLASAGLAIDGGGMFFLWRDVRNATDAAVLAAAFSRCSNKNVVSQTELVDRVKQAALSAAAANNFVDTNPDDETDFPDVIVTYPFDTTNPDHADQIAKFPPGATLLNYVAVSIQAEKTKYFIGIVYPGPLTVETYAVGQCTPRIDPSQVKGLVALGDCNNTISYTGNDGDLYTDFFSNGDVRFNGGGAMSKIYGDVVYGPDVTDPPGDDDEDEYYANGKTTYPVTDRFTPARQGTVSRTTTGEKEDMLQLDLELLYGPGSEFRSELEAAGGTYHYYSGDITISGNKLNHVAHTMEGFYYVDGTINISGSTAGEDGVSFVATGDITVGTHVYGYGGGMFEYYIHDAIEGTVGDGILLATSVGQDSPFCGVGSGGIKYNGSVDTHGFMYAPYAPINMSFSSSNFWGATIGQSIQLSGSALEYHYDDGVIPFAPGSVSIPQ